MREYEAEVDLVLTEFFDHVDGGYINRRADKEIEHYKAKVEQASRAGRASAERRTNGRSTDVQPTSNQEPITIVKAKQSRGTRLPADWAISVENIEFCNKTRPDLSPMETASRFKDYWTAQAGSKGVKLDWDATWRNWVRAERSKDTVSKPQALVGWK